MSDPLDTRLRAAREGLPAPSPEETAAAREAFVAAGAAPRRPRRPGRRRALAFALAAAALVAAFGGGYAVASADGRSASPPPAEEPRREADAGPGFLPAEGWDVAVTAVDWPVTLQAPTAVAANIPLAPEDRSVDAPPAETARRLGPNGVLFYAVFYPAGATKTDERLLPLRLADAEEVGSFEGMAHVPSTRRLVARVGRYDVDVLLFFGAEKPAPGVLAAAAQQLGRLVVPSCPDALPLAEADLPAAEAFVLDWLGSHYQEDPADLEDARATATLGADMPRMGQARTACGAEVAGRTAEVDVVLPRLERVSASLSQLAYLVSRTADGWTVWQRLR